MKQSASAVERKPPLSYDSRRPAESSARKPVIWTVSVSRVSRLLADITPEFDGRAQIEAIPLGFESAVAHIRRRLLSEPCDVLLAAGSNGAYLRHRVGLPVVLVRATGFDLLNALSRARRVSEHIGLITHQTDLPEFSEFREQFGLHIEQRRFVTAEEARHCVAELVALGAKAIVGTGMVTDLAEQAGVTGLLLYSSESVREAFESAIELAGMIDSAGRQGAVARSPRRRRASTRYALADLLGDSAVMRRLRETIAVYARSAATVLLHGATGTGKELAAQALHGASARRSGPFVAVNCGAIAESLLEAELFGYEEGAFTGSRRGGRVGLIEAADGGSLFLDEIGEMALPLQTRLLRVLEEREVMRVGSARPHSVDIRVIAATHADLAARVAEGRFRADLYYRINVLRLELPRLLDRAEDIEALLYAFLRRTAGGERLVLEPEALATLQVYDWPGNVRELRNLGERLALLGLSRPGVVRIDAALLRSLLPEWGHAGLAQPPAIPVPSAAKAKVEPLAAATALTEVLKRCGGNRAAAAAELGVSRTTLWRWMRRAAPH